MKVRRFCMLTFASMRENLLKSFKVNDLVYLVTKSGEEASNYAENLKQTHFVYDFLIYEFNNNSTFYLKFSTISCKCNIKLIDNVK